MQVLVTFVLFKGGFKYDISCIEEIVSTVEQEVKTKNCQKH